MDRLPEELLVLITDHCDHASLKQTRLVHSRWRAASTPGVFEHIYLGLFSNSLTKLKSLTTSPLVKHVKKLTFFSDVLPDWSKEAYLKAIDFRPTFREWLTSLDPNDREAISRDTITRKHLKPFELYDSLPKHGFSTQQLDNGYAAYKAAVRDQVEWRNEQVGRLFRELLSRIPNLVEAEVQCTLPFVGRTNSWPVWRSLRKTILVGPDDWMYNTDLHDDQYALLSGQAALALLEGVAFRGSFSGNTPVKSLTIHSAHVDAYAFLLMKGLPEVSSSIPTPFMQRYNALLDAFTSLSTLSLHIPHATLSARLTGYEVADETMQFLRRAKHLRKLKLRYGDDELSPDDDASHLEPLFQDVHWPELRELHLATNVSAETLVTFFERHATTLKVLDMRDMLVPNVDVALRELPSILNLEHVYVECLWTDAGDSSVNYLCTLSRGTDFDAPYEKAVRAYLLGDITRMPQIERDGGLHEPEDWEEDDPDVQMVDESDGGDDN